MDPLAIAILVFACLLVGACGGAAVIYATVAQPAKERVKELAMANSNLTSNNQDLKDQIAHTRTTEQHLSSDIRANGNELKALKQELRFLRKEFQALLLKLRRQESKRHLDSVIQALEVIAGASSKSQAPTPP